jgi:GAF domain-containing protein
MSKVISLPPSSAFTLRLARGATLQLTPFHDSPYVALTLSGPAGGDAGGIMIHADSARTLGSWLQLMADQCGSPIRRAREPDQVPTETAAAAHLLAPPPARIQDCYAAAAAFARAAVPVFADWCSIDVVEDTQVIRRLAVVQADTSKNELARKLAQYPPDPNGRHPRSQVLRTGQPDIAFDVGDDRLATLAQDEEHLALLRAVGVRSSVIVPLVERAKVIGLMSFVSAESGRRYRESDLPLALTLARCTALAVDNVRLYREAQQALREKLRDSPARRPRSARRRMRSA